MERVIPPSNRWFAYAITFGAGALQIIAAVILSRVAFQSLAESDLKLWFVMMAAMPFVSLFELGANVVLPHRFAQASYKPDAINTLMANFMAAVALVLSGVLTLGIIVCITAVWLELIHPTLATILIALGLAAILRVLGNVLQGGLYAMDDNNYEKTIRIGSVVAMFITGVTGLTLGCGLYSMPMAWTAAALLSITLSLTRLRKHWRIQFRGVHFHWTAVKEMLASSSRYVAIALPGQLVFNATPFIIAAQLPASFSISYGLTQQLIAGIALVAGLPITIIVPRLAAQHRDSVAAAASTLLNTTRNAALIAACCLVVVGLNRFEILSIWVGRPVHIDSAFIAIYFFAMFIEWQQTALTTAAMATGNFRFVLITTASAILVVGTMPMFINWFGFTGVPLAILTAQSLTCHPHNYALALRIYRIRFLRYLSTLRSASIAAALIAAGYLLLDKAGITGLWKLTTMMLAGIAIAATLHTLSAYTIKREMQ